MYKVEVECSWYDKTSQTQLSTDIKKIKKTFTNRTKEDVYQYIKYFAEHNGMRDVTLIEEGEYNE